MGKVQKQVDKRRDEQEALKDAFIADLMWYVESMNKLMKQFATDVNNLNEALTTGLKEKKGALN